jgi:hypothetical protein
VLIYVSIYRDCFHTPHNQTSWDLWFDNFCQDVWVGVRTFGKPSGPLRNCQDVCCLDVWVCGVLNFHESYCCKEYFGIPKTSRFHNLIWSISRYLLGLFIRAFYVTFPANIFIWSAFEKNLSDWVLRSLKLSTNIKKKINKQKNDPNQTIVSYFSDQFHFVLLFTKYLCSVWAF